MTSSEPTDTFVIYYTKPRDLWAAFSIQTRQVGVGANPKEALANAIAAAHQAIEASAEHIGAHVCNATYELMLTLGRVAQPLTDGECSPGLVYKYERAWPR